MTGRELRELLAYTLLVASMATVLLLAWFTS